MAGNEKRILVFAITYHPFIGGAEVALKEITERLKNYHFTLITLRIDKALPKFEVRNNVSIYRIGVPSKRKLQPALNWQLMLSKYFFPFQAYFLARKLNKKTNFDISWSIMANYAGFAGLFFKSANPKIPFVLTLQEGDSPEHIKRKVGSLMPLYRKIFSKADKIQVISKFLSDYARKMGAKREALIIPNGVDLSLFDKNIPVEEISMISNKMGKEQGDIFLITSSRLVKKNGIDILINSLTFMSQNFKLFIAGEGEEGGSLKSLVSELKLENRVRFGDFIPQEKLPLYLKACDIFARPSRSEGFGNSFIEAMAAGLPVIAAPVGGVIDFLKPEENGLFCNPEDPKNLAKQAKRLIDNNKLRETIIENGYKTAKKYDWNLISQRVDSEIFRMTEVAPPSFVK